MNLVSEKKARRDGIRITYTMPKHYQVKYVQNVPVPLVGTYFLVNRNGHRRRVDLVVTSSGLDNDLLLNLGTQKSLGLIYYNLLKMDDSVFKNVKSTSECIGDSDKVDYYEFDTSNMIMDNECTWIRKVSLERKDTDKEQKLQEIEERLARKYTPEVFKDNL